MVIELVFSIIFYATSLVYGFTYIFIDGSVENLLWSLGTLIVAKLWGIEYSLRGLQ